MTFSLAFRSLSASTRSRASLLRSSSPVWMRTTTLPVARSSILRFSTTIDDTPAHIKLQHCLEEYRQKNFGHTLFSRFVKEMLVASDVNHDGKISRSELSRLLVNIGAKPVVLTDADLQAVIDEFGDWNAKENEKVIDISYLEELILGTGEQEHTA